MPRKSARLPADAARTNKKRRQKADQGTLIFRSLGILAIALAVVTIALFAVKYSRGLAADKNASDLLAAFKDKATASPAQSAASPSPRAPAELTPKPEDAEPSPTPTDKDFEQTDAKADEAAAADVNSLRVDDGSDKDVDEGGEYVQPDAPEHTGEIEELIAKIIASEGEDGVVGTIEIPEIDIELPIIGKWSYKLLKISVCRYLGPLPNQPGNCVLAGHNYKSGAHFGRLSKLSVGSEIFVTDALTNTRMRYEVYQIKSIAPDAFSALKPFEGECGLTLLTCKDNGTNRLLLRCVQVPAE